MLVGAEDEGFLRMGQYLLDDVRQMHENLTGERIASPAAKKKRFNNKKPKRATYSGDDERGGLGSSTERDDKKHFDYTTPDNILQPWINDKIQHLIKKCRDNKINQVTYTFPPLLSSQRAYIHRMCKRNGITTESGPEIPYRNAQKKQSLKQMHIIVRPNSTLNIGKLKIKGRKEPIEHTNNTFIKGGVIQHQEEVNVEIQQPDKMEVDKVTKEYKKHAEFGEFIQDSSIGGAVMGMMAKMGYVEGKGLGKTKQGIVNPITISRISNKIFQMNCDTDEKPTRERVVRTDVKDVKRVQAEEVSDEDSYSDVSDEEENVQESEEEKIVHEDPMFHEHDFDRMPQSVYLRHIQDKMEDIILQAHESSLPVTFKYPPIGKNKHVIQLHNLCKKYKLECVSSFDDSDFDQEKEFANVHSMEKLLSRKGRKVIVVTAIPSISILPSSRIEQTREEMESMKHSHVPEEEYINKVIQVPAKKIKEQQKVDVGLMDDIEFAKFIETKLSYIVGLCDADIEPTVTYTFAPMSGARRSVLFAVCSRSNIGAEIDTKSKTRQAKMKALVDMSETGLSGVKVTAAFGISKKPKRNFIRSIMDNQLNQGATSSFASGSASEKMSYRKNKKQKFRKKKHEEHENRQEVPSFDFSSIIAPHEFA
jgi:hypothetical protein